MFHRTFLALLLFLISFVETHAQDPAKPDLQKQIQQAVQNLGSSRFDLREQAEKDLLKIGAPALEALREAVKSKDREIRQRAQKLVRRLEASAVGSKLLMAKTVELNQKDVPLSKAVDALVLASGYPVKLSDRARLGKKQITIATGETTFWKALDQLATTAGLSSQGTTLQEGPSNVLTTHYAGAVRIRLLAPTAQQQTQKKPGELLLVLQLDAEPRLMNVKQTFPPKISKALDDQGQTLEPISTQKLIRLESGAKPTKILKELAGKLWFQALAPTEPLVVVKNVSKSVGSKVVAKEHAIDVKSFGINEKGEIAVDVSLEQERDPNSTPGMQFRPGGYIEMRNGRVRMSGAILRGGVRISRGKVSVGGKSLNLNPGDKSSLPALVDEKGQPFQLVKVTNDFVRITQTRREAHAQLVFHANPEQGKPDQLILRGRRMVNVPVEFSFQNVPLK